MNHFAFDPNSDRIAIARKRLTDAYSRKAGSEVPVVDGRVPGGPYTYRQRLQDPEKMLEHAVILANNLAAADNDWPPHIDTFCTVVMVAEAFGCPLTMPETDLPWTLPALYDINGVWNLKPLKAMESPQIRANAEWIDYAQRKLGTDLPFWTLDIQSPFSAAAQIVDPTELLASCIADPRAVHHLCRMVTDFTIEMMTSHIAQMEHPGFPGRNFPSISENIGICIADDTPIVTLSPDMYREFAQPYNNEIAEVFGAVHIHSCGNYSYNLDALMETRNIRSIQLHAGKGEFDLPESPDLDHPFNRARVKVAYFVDTNVVSRGDTYRGRPRDHYERYVLPRLTAGDMTGCILEGAGPEWSFDEVQAGLSWTRAKLGG